MPSDLPRLALLAAALGALLAAPASAQTLERIARTGEIRIGVRSDAAPLSYMRDGKPAGYTVDLCLGAMDHIEKEGLPAGAKTPLTPVFVSVGTEDRFDRLARGEIDMLCGAASVTLSRRAIVDFSIPVYIDGASVLLPKDGPADFAGLAGQRIGVRGGTTTAEALEATLASLSMQAEIVDIDDHAAGLEAVLDGRVAAYFADQSILFWLLRGSERRDALKVSGRTLTVEPQAIGLPLGDSAFRLTVDTALSRLFRSGAAARMFEYNFAPAVMGDAMKALTVIAPLPE